MRGGINPANGRRSAKNKRSGKYVSQRWRTTVNKANARRRHERSSGR